MQIKQIHFTRIFLLMLLTTCINYSTYAQTETADPADTDQIITWGNDGVTTKIIFPAGTYEFAKTISFTNNDLILEGSGTDNTILKLTAQKNSLIDAKGNNYRISNLTLDGNNNQKAFGTTIFRFNKSKGHQFENVLFINSIWNAINAINAYATDGLVLKNCVFENITYFPLQIFNRNTNVRGGEVIVSVDKVLIDGCVFKEGYQTAISCDNGNDRQDSGDGTGRRYTESTSINGTVIQNCTFEKSTQFHIAMVQTKDVIIQNNVFQGMTDDAGGGCQPLHFEQFTQNIEIYDNTFYMPNTVSQSYTYIHMNGTEGHKRVTQQQPSNTYETWTYSVSGSNERRADTKCAREGHINKDCKRDVHAYGARNIFIAGNTFHPSTKIAKYIVINEGENIEIGNKKDGTLSLNNFMGGSPTTKMISFGGNDQGTGNVLIMADQNIQDSNVEIRGVSFDLPALHLTQPIVVKTSNPTSLAATKIEGNEFSFSPNPAQNYIDIHTSYNEYSLQICDLKGTIVKQFTQKDASNKTIYVGNLKPGMYLVVWQNKLGKKQTERLLIQTQ